MKLGFVFPGQGCQWVGMGKDLFTRFPEARAVFDAADDALGEKLSQLCFEGPEETLKLTANTQPAVLTTSIAAWAVFAKRAPVPLYAAGHSLGEYSALVATGSLSLGSAVRAVRDRGRLMQEAVPAGVGAMAAVLGLPADQVGQVCVRLAQGRVLSPANYNSPEQTVIAGHADADRTLTLLLEQVSRPVRWVECVEEMRRQGVTHFIELGPGKVLRGLIKQISKDTPVFGIEDAQSLDRALAGMGGG